MALTPKQVDLLIWFRRAKKAKTLQFMFSQALKKASSLSEQADLIADNRLSELAEIDSAMLKDMLEEIDTGALDMELTGFTIDELEDMFTAAPPPKDPFPAACAGAAEAVRPRRQQPPVRRPP